MGALQWPAVQREFVKNAYKNNRRSITRVLYTALLASFGVRLYRNLAVPRKATIATQGEKSEVPGTPDDKAEHAVARSKPKVAVDLQFLRNLVRLLRIAFPRLVSQDTLFVALQAVSLVVRTYLSLYVARLDGQITALLVRGEGRKFLHAVAWWMVIGAPASAVNAAIQYLQRTIALRVRSRLTDYALNRYLVADQEQPVYYALQQHESVNVGQLMAADTAKFALSLSKLYSNLAKPILDVGVYTYQLSKCIGGDNVFLLGLAIQVSARALRLAAPPFGEFVAAEATLEGDFRQGHSRLIEYAEEIALYDGHVPEKLRLDQSFYALVLHINRVLRRRLAYSSLEDFVMKYVWGAAGLLLCSVPVFSGESNPHTRAQEFVVNRKLLMLSSDALGRVMSSYKEISSLAGITARVSEFLAEIDALAEETEPKSRALLGSNSVLSGGTVETGDYVEFAGVPIVSPAGETLVKSLSFRIDPGQHLLIVGPNGSGKSSLFRVLGGLWPVVEGRIVRPPHNDMFYIPQRPYLSRGSLRQQIIYPSSETENKISDDGLLEILRILGIEHLVDSVGGWDVVREWRDDLSMGAQQKIAAARLFYHRPRFAILDECTASVTLDAETTIYTHAQELGISLLTVSHRASLWKYHDKILQFDGQGGYLFADLNPSERLALEEEKLKIDYQLRQVESMTERLEALERQKGRRSSTITVA